MSPAVRRPAARLRPIAAAAALAATAVAAVLVPGPWAAQARAETIRRLGMDGAVLVPEALREDGLRLVLRREGGAEEPAIVWDGAEDGSWVLRLASGPTPPGSRADRAEVTLQGGLDFGRAWAIGFRVLVPDGAPLPETWHLLMQCHQAGTALPPPLSLNLDPDGALVLVNRGDADGYRELWRGPLPRGRWVAVALEFRLGEGGRARLLLDGEEAASVPTPLFWAAGEDRCTLKAGLYRGPSGVPFALLLDDLALGESAADVAPPGR